MKKTLFLVVFAFVCLSAGAQTRISSPSGTINGHGYVNLGLSVKWATCNVGAASVSDYGDYYAWGEIRTKAEYTKGNSVTYGKTIGDIAGDPQFDAAKAKWGGTWRLPTPKEMEELVKKCTWKWVKVNGHNGYMVIGPNGNSIFLPANGVRKDATFDGIGAYAQYWSSEPFEDWSVGLQFDKEEFVTLVLERSRGRGIRPVSK